MIRRLLVLLALVLAAPAAAEGCRVSNGIDYRFERMSAVRAVQDERDRGKISLVAYVYRPLKIDRRAIIVFSHGSTGGFQFDPKEPQPIVHCSLKNYFLTRGYTLVAFTRRGRGESGGSYVEECAPFLDPACTPERTREMSDSALRQALEDSRAVLDQLVLGRLKRPGDRIVLAGHSRGGVLSLALAAERARQIAAVINFAGGWLGVQSGPGAAGENAKRAAYHQQLFTRLGASSSPPSLWIYATGDPLYGPDITRRFYDAFSPGGRAEWLLVAEHGLENGHLLLQESRFWSAQLDGFLDRTASNAAP